MARNNRTSVDFWLNLPLTQLSGWISVNNEIEADNQKRLNQ